MFSILKICFQCHIFIDGIYIKCKTLAETPLTVPPDPSPHLGRWEGARAQGPLFTLREYNKNVKLK